MDKGRKDPDEIQVNLQDVQARLDKLERHDWIRWVLAFAVMLALTAGLFALSMPVGQSAIDQQQLNLTVRGLLGLVLLFDVFVVHQQFTMKKMRRELAAQAGLIAALESLRVSDENESPRAERRRVRRSGLDRRLCVSSVHDGKPSAIYGRIRDICEDGLGAVIPCSLRIGEHVTLQFSVEDEIESEIRAVVRHRKSFHYGFEFIDVDAAARRGIARFVAEAAAMRASTI